MGPDEWSWLATQRRRVSFVVVNVHNGPGSSVDNGYVHAMAQLKGIKKLGYVAVDYGNRSVEDVTDDIRKWRSNYALDSIMFDELPSAAHSLARCAQYVAAARAAGVRFIGANPGMFPSLAHLNLFDVTCVFEGTADSYEEFQHPVWAGNVPASRLWHLVYECSPALIKNAETIAARRNAGHVFMTDRSLPNPWLGPSTPISSRLVEKHQLGSGR